MIAIIDYGVGNLFSLTSSLGSIGAETVITSDPDVIRKADKLLLPGVGAFSGGTGGLLDLAPAGTGAHMAFCLRLAAVGGMGGTLLLSAAAGGFAVGGFSCFVDFLCHNSDPLIVFAASGVLVFGGPQSV